VHSHKIDSGRSETASSKDIYLFVLRPSLHAVYVTEKSLGPASAKLLLKIAYFVVTLATKTVYEQLEA